MSQHQLINTLQALHIEIEMQSSTKWGFRPEILHLILSFHIRSAAALRSFDRLFLSIQKGQIHSPVLISLFELNFVALMKQKRIKNDNSVLLIWYSDVGVA